MSLYDGLRYDLDCLIQVLLAIESIDPWQARRDSSNPVIQELKQPLPNFGRVETLLEEIIKKGHPDRSLGLADDRLISKRLWEL